MKSHFDKLKMYNGCSGCESWFSEGDTTPACSECPDVAHWFRNQFQELAMVRASRGPGFNEDMATSEMPCEVEGDCGECDNFYLCALGNLAAYENNRLHYELSPTIPAEDYLELAHGRCLCYSPSDRYFCKHGREYQDGRAYSTGDAIFHNGSHDAMYMKAKSEFDSRMDHRAAMEAEAAVIWSEWQGGLGTGAKNPGASYCAA